MQITNLFTSIFTLFLLFAACQLDKTPNEVKMDELKFVKQEDGTKLAHLKDKVFTGKAASYHDNGIKYIEETYVEGKKAGLWKIWLKDGKLYKEGHLHGGRDHGPYLEFYPSGKLKYEYHYDMGKKVGDWKSWYENGQQWTERQFNNDQLDGKVLVWDTDGTLTKEYTYQKGRMIGKQLNLDKSKSE